MHRADSCRCRRRRHRARSRRASPDVGRSGSRPPPADGAGRSSPRSDAADRCRRRFWASPSTRLPRGWGPLRLPQGQGPVTSRSSVQPFMPACALTSIVDLGPLKGRALEVARPLWARAQHKVLRGLGRRRGLTRTGGWPTCFTSPSRSAGLALSAQLMAIPRSDVRVDRHLRWPEPGAATPLDGPRSTIPLGNGPVRSRCSS